MRTLWLTMAVAVLVLRPAASHAGSAGAQAKGPTALAAEAEAAAAESADGDSSGADSDDGDSADGDSADGDSGDADSGDADSGDADSKRADAEDAHHDDAEHGEAEDDASQEARAEGGRTETSGAPPAEPAVAHPTRPGFSEGVAVAGLSTLEVEAGLSGGPAGSGLDLLLRYGADRDFELRLGAAQHVGATPATVFGIHAKARLLDPGGAGLGLALVPGVTLGTGPGLPENALALRAIASYLYGPLAVDLNLVLEAVGDPQATTLYGRLTPALGVTVSVTDLLRLFAEGRLTVSGRATSPERGPGWAATVGGSYAVRPHLVVDATVEVGAAGDAAGNASPEPAWQALVGLTWALSL